MIEFGEGLVFLSVGIVHLFVTVTPSPNIVGGTQGKIGTVKSGHCSLVRCFLRGMGHPEALVTGNRGRDAPK